jgi:hypothetical protein
MREHAAAQLPDIADQDIAEGAAERRTSEVCHQRDQVKREVFSRST